MSDPCRRRSHKGTETEKTDYIIDAFETATILEGSAFGDGPFSDSATLRTTGRDLLRKFPRFWL